MKTCKERISQIHWLVEGELSPQEELELKEHIECCSECSEKMEEFSLTKSFVEENLEARIALPEKTSVVRLAMEADPHHRMRVLVGGSLKKALVGVAAGLAIVMISAHIFGRHFFQRTLPYQLKKTVLRCSDGLEKRYPGAEWEKLLAGDSLKNATAIRTPAGARSFLSFDGIRLFVEGKGQFQTDGRRAISLQEGEMVASTTEEEIPLTVSVANSSVRSKGGIFRIACSGDSVSLGVAAGVVELLLSDGVTHTLIANQVASFGIDQAKLEVAQAEVDNPFSYLRVSVLDRIKKRFAEVISRYLPNYLLSRRAIERFGRPEILEIVSRPEKMLQFASYSSGSTLRLARGSSEAISDYYESLFAPSNRSISIGRRKLVPLGANNTASYPTWSHDGSMIAYMEFNPNRWPTEVKVVRLDDLDNPWVISQECDTNLPMFPLAWAPDNRHVLFMMTDNLKERDNGWDWDGPYKIKIAPIDPSEGPIREFNSPFSDIPLDLALPVGKTISPQIVKLPWGDALLCCNWGNIGYVPIEQDGQAVAGNSGMFLTDFDYSDLFVAGAGWSPSGSKIIFVAVENRQNNPPNVYILYDVEDILDGFSQPPRSVDDPRIKRLAASENAQLPGGFSFDESLVFFQEDVNRAWRSERPTNYHTSDFDLFYASALPGEPGRPTQIRLPWNQLFLAPSPEGNRIAYCFNKPHSHQLRIVSFDIEADMDTDLGGVLIDNSGTNLIVPPGTLQENFAVNISTPFTIGDEAEPSEGETTFFAMRLIDAQGLENPAFIEPMTLTIRYTDDEVAGLDEGMLEIYYYDESDPEHSVWVPLGGAVDPDHNEITVEIQHFSKFSIGGQAPGVNPGK